MPWGLKRYQQARCLHFITFSCFHRAPLLASPQARRVFEHTLERVRQWYGLYVTGYVVMPEHVHLLMSEPERTELAVAIQMLKQIVGHELRHLNPGKPFWQARYYDFNVWTERKLMEKLRYIHRNPVRGGLAQNPADWPWSSFRHYLTGEEGVVEIESHWMARRREEMGVTIQIVRCEENPHPVPPKNGGTRAGHPRV
jgi:putative transposase